MNQNQQQSDGVQKMSEEKAHDKKRPLAPTGLPKRPTEKPKQHAPKAPSLDRAAKPKGW